MPFIHSLSQLGSPRSTLRVFSVQNVYEGVFLNLKSIGNKEWKQDWAREKPSCKLGPMTSLVNPTEALELKWLVRDGPHCPAVGGPTLPRWLITGCGLPLGEHNLGEQGSQGRGRP